jgi:hypothetical protein
MMRGGDWVFGCQLVAGALGALNTPPTHMPIRVFTPQVLAPTGAKLSKSLLRERGGDALPADVEPWMLDTTAWPGGVDDYVGAVRVDVLHQRRGQVRSHLRRHRAAARTRPASAPGTRC